MTEKDDYILPLPMAIIEGLPEDEAVLVLDWWRRLEAHHRHELEWLWRQRPSAYGIPAHHHSRKRIEVFVQAEFTEEMEPETNHFPDSLCDFLGTHAVEYGKDCRLIICTLDPEARQAIRAGFFPIEFQCPKGMRACKMRQVLDLVPARHLKLAVRCRLLDHCGQAVAVI